MAPRKRGGLSRGSTETPHRHGRHMNVPHNGGYMRIIVTVFLFVVLALPAGAVSIPEPPSPVPTPFTFYCSRCDPGPSLDRAGHNQVCLDCTNQDEPCDVTRDCVTPV